MATDVEVGLKQRRKAAVLGVAGAAFAAAALAAVSAAHGAVGPITGTSPLAPPLGACLGPQCPGTWPPPHNGDFGGRDAAINIYAGTDFSATGRAAEAEGKIVVLGDFTVDKSGGGIFNAGVVGVGSRVPPPDGSDFVTVGGNVTVQPTDRLEVGGTDANGPAYGNLVYGGTATGTINVVPPGQAIQRPGAADQYSDLRGYIEDRSACAATAPATGTVSVSPSAVTFTGDGTSMLQVFDVPGDIGGASTVGIEFDNIPSGATVLVNMTGTAPVINTYTGTGLAGDQTTELRPHLMWNFPNATSATIRGGAQFQGSILGGNPAGTLSIQTPGQNGRVYVAGGLVLTNSNAGSEIHAYPFDGVLPECGSAPTSSSSSSSSEPTVSTSDTGTTSAPTTAPTSSAPTSSSSSTTTGPSSGSAMPTTPSGTQPSFSTSPSGRGLAATGSSLAPALGLAAAALSVGAGVLAFTSRKKGKHA
ncbi:choice-of-anchor A family protein [Catenulispora sp. NF23]|uniref:Choice-of-anchor A family protein n=1 Tax=Catenulispora pinistramenti TaxID=2705254 RepID=A0ABS5KJM4_9ACTN|nr:choice-of-anchor A family protein [Catenulispora pinistramenti]MBS2533024.1 choice-of-anchor A family protein [Catenulispora pinistramenti]MBS2546539.1 choice-of-anchor A family protein [Catenulispora pinistramenti]